MIIKNKIDEKGVYMCDDEEYEYPNDEINNLNVALKNKKKIIFKCLKKKII